jgi:chromosome segregation ATPase
MRGKSVNLRIKLNELRGQRSWLRRDVQELRVTLEDRNSRLEDMRVMLVNRNDEVAALEERVSSTRDERNRLQLRHKKWHCVESSFNSVVNNASTLYLTVEELLSTYVALMMPRVL